jgi:hypothetical protein
MAVITATFPRLFPSARRKPRPGASRAPLRPHRVAATPEGSRRGPGWFDSSWDLRQGLEVHEGLPADARLNEWIEVCLHS